MDLPLAESGGAALSAVVALKLALYRLLLARGTRIPVNGVIGTVYANQSMSTKSGISTMLELNETTIEKPHVLTILNTPSPEKRIEEFGGWLRQTGASDVTVKNYTQAVARWVAVIDANQSLRPAEVWLRWAVTPPMKRLTGYAVRRWREYCESVLGIAVDVGVPSRLPAPSAPRPRPIADRDFRLLRLTAKAMLPFRTAVSFRIWITLLEELGLRRTESAIEWDQIHGAGSVVVTGKTGERELPISRRLLRLLGWLRLRNPGFPWVGARGQKLSGGVLYNIFKAVAAASGLPDMRPHFLRHRRLTKLCRSHLGTNRLLVLAFAGHSNVGSLASYYEVSLDEKRALQKAA